VWLYGYEFKSFLSVQITFALFAGPKRKRLGKLHRYAPKESPHLLDPTDVAATNEIGHIKRLVRLKARNAKPSHYLLAWIRTIVVGVTRERRTPAGNIDHLPLHKGTLEILSKPHRPMITKSMFASSLSICLHY
jgi:hypothetical protein